MEIVTLAAPLFVGVVIGFVIAALLVMAKDRPAEDEGAASFAFEVLDRIADWRVDLSLHKTANFERDLIRMCDEAIDRAQDHELQNVI